MAVIVARMSAMMGAYGSVSPPERIGAPIIVRVT
jgi:hypothetical protein